MRRTWVVMAAVLLAGCGSRVAATDAPTTPPPTTVAEPSTTTSSTVTSTSTSTTSTSTSTTTSTTVATATTEGTTVAHPAPRGTVIEYAEPGQHWATTITSWNPDATVLVEKADRYGLNKVEPGLVFAIVTVRTTHVSGNPARSPISYRLQVAGPSAVAADLDIGCTISINSQATLNATVLDGGTVDEHICYQLAPADAAAPVALISGADGTPIYLALT